MGNKLKRSELLVYERKKEKNRYMSLLNLCLSSASIAVAERLMSLHTHC